MREFLDTLPAGFPAAPSGVELKILKKLFTEEEAALTMQLRNDPEEEHGSYGPKGKRLTKRSCWK